MKMAVHTKQHGHYMGHEKEPPQPHGPKARGKKPPVHSHSAVPQRKIITRKRGGKNKGF